MRKILLTVVVSHHAELGGVIIPIALTVPTSETDGEVIDRARKLADGVSGPFDERRPDRYFKHVSIRVEELVSGKIVHVYSGGSTGRAFFDN